MQFLQIFTIGNSTLNEPNMTEYVFVSLFA